MKQKNIINFEIKAKCSDHKKIRDYLTRNGSVSKGTDHQIDTYFNVPDGRLKLREGLIENNLIFYKRNNKSGPKRSEVNLAVVEKDSGIRGVLEHALGVKIRVDKKREIYFIDNVKFHIDTVDSLGAFMEIEAIDSDGSIGPDSLRKQCEKYMQEMGINQQDLIKDSYSDMLLAKSS